VETPAAEIKEEESPTVNHWFVLHDFAKPKPKNAVDMVDTGDALYFAYLCSVMTLYIMLALFFYVKVFKKGHKLWKQPIEPSGTYSSWPLC
jgi:hypothetical protein